MSGPNEINRAVFNGRIGEIALNLGLVSPDVQARMIEVQARAIALAPHAQASIEQLQDDAQWQQLKTQYGITPDALTSATTMASGGAPITVPNIPPAGAVLSSIPGGIDPIVKDALLTAQASEKAFAALQQARAEGQGYDEAGFEQRLQAINAMPDFVHLNRAGEQGIVAKAQQVYKTALQFDAVEHHADNNVAAQDPELAKLRGYLATTLPQQVATTYRSAAIALGLRAEQLTKEGNPHASVVAGVADRFLNTLANDPALRIAPPTPEELAQFAKDNPELGVSAATVQEAHTSTQRFVDAENARRNGPNGTQGLAV